MIAGEIGTRPWYQSGEPCEQIQGVEQKVGSAVAVRMLQGVAKAALLIDAQAVERQRWTGDIAARSFQTLSLPGLASHGGIVIEAYADRWAFLVRNLDMTISAPSTGPVQVYSDDASLMPGTVVLLPFSPQTRMLANGEMLRDALARCQDAGCGVIGVPMYPFIGAETALAGAADLVNTQADSAQPR